MATPVYAFETDLFGVSDNGIHLLRSGYNYETIPFAEVAHARVVRGKELHNWVIILTIGLALLAFAVYYVLRMVMVIGNDQVDRIYVEAIVVPIIPCMLGGYCVLFCYTTRPGAHHPNNIGKESQTAASRVGEERCPRKF